MGRGEKAARGLPLPLRTHRCLSVNELSFYPQIRIAFALSLNDTQLRSMSLRSSEAPPPKKYLLGRTLYQQGWSTAGNRNLRSGRSVGVVGVIINQYQFSLIT